MADRVKFYRKVNDSLKKGLFKHEYEFLCNALSSFTRILPHVEGASWQKIRLKQGQLPEHFAHWDGPQRRSIKVQIYVPKMEVFLQTNFKRKAVDRKIARTQVLDNTEMSICRSIANIASNGCDDVFTLSDARFATQLTRSFDDFVILDHLKKTHKLDYRLGDLFEFLKELSEQSYENKSLSFGVIVDKKKTPEPIPSDMIFPKDYLQEETSKKFRAFTDGYRTSFLLDNFGRIKSLLDLEADAKNSLTGEHYFPEWCRNIATSCSSTSKKIGISLTRQGDILFFENGSMKFTRRFGKWQYWSHSYIIEILKTLARARNVKPAILGKVVSFLYKYALDISFKHTGGLLVILRNRAKIHKIVRQGDGLKDAKRTKANRQFDKFIEGKSLFSIDRNIIIDLASIDGALVFSNHGKLLAYGAVLSTSRRKFMNSAEGSRSKAAIGSSYLGVSIKISSDGDISIYSNGKKFIQI